MALVRCSECRGTVSSTAQWCPQCGAPRSSFSGGKRLKTLIFAAVVAAMYFFLVPDDEVRPTAALSKKEQVLSQLSVRSSETVGTFGVMDVELHIGNPTDYKIKNIKIECVDKSNTYVELSKNRAVVYDFIEARQRLRVPKLEMGIAHSQRSFTICEAVDFEFAE